MTALGPADDVAVRHSLEGATRLVPSIGFPYVVGVWCGMWQGAKRDVVAKGGAIAFTCRGS